MSEVLIVAAEASAGLFAQRLLELWKRERKAVKAFGIGTPEMEALGFERLGKSEDMAVMGIIEIVDNYKMLKTVFENVVAACALRKPKVAILMDYPGFNLRLAKRLKALGIPVVYYISPQVWAWRKGRVKTIRECCDKMLVIFPFEAEFYQKNGVSVEFVGHPVLDEMKPELFDPQHRKLGRNRRGIQDGEFVLGLMPGSRRGELRQHMAVQIETARLLAHEFQNLKVVVFTAPTLDLEEVRASLGDDVKIPIQVIKDDPLEMILIADFILAASGTATLMVGLLGVPMAIMYKFKFLTGLIARVVVRGVKFFGLPNLILGREVVPERWQGGADAVRLAPLIAGIVRDHEKLAAMRKDLEALRERLGNKGATERVARVLDRYIEV